MRVPLLLDPFFRVLFFFKFVLHKGIQYCTSGRSMHVQAWRARDLGPKALRTEYLMTVKLPRSPHFYFRRSSTLGKISSKRCCLRYRAVLFRDRDQKPPKTVTPQTVSDCLIRSFHNPDCYLEGLHLFRNSDASHCSLQAEFCLVYQSWISEKKRYPQLHCFNLTAPSSLI
jgi:hypothetical protein